VTKNVHSTFFVTFFSATIDDRDLIFGHKLHIGSPYCGKHFLTRQIPTSCLPKSVLPSTVTEKNATKNILDGRKDRRKDRQKDGRTDGRTDRQTDRGKTVYPPPPSGEALKNGSNAVDCVTTVVKCLEVCTM
jgi:hypothetical protein